MVNVLRTRFAPLVLGGLLATSGLALADDGSGVREVDGQSDTYEFNRGPGGVAGDIVGGVLDGVFGRDGRRHDGRGRGGWDRGGGRGGWDHGGGGGGWDHGGGGGWDHGGGGGGGNNGGYHDWSYNGQPVCQYTDNAPASGWSNENGQTCRMPDWVYPYCANSNDQDGDGYGWENDHACRLSWR